MYRSRALKSRTDLSKTSLVHRNLSLSTVTFGEKVLTLAKSCGSEVRGYGSLYFYKELTLSYKVNLQQAMPKVENILEC